MSEKIKKSVIQSVTHERMLQVLINHVLREHPLPWRVRRDWSYEVVAEDNTIIAKCMSGDEAQAIIDFAEEWKRLSDEVVRDLERELVHECGDVAPLPPRGQLDVRAITRRVAGAFRSMAGSGEDAALRQAIANEGGPENDD